MNKNDRLTLTITAMSSEGLAIAKDENNTPVFISGGAIGDVVDVIIVKVLKNYAFGKIVNIVTESKDRISPDCNVFSQCGGCCYRHINYSAECDIKHKRVFDAIQRIGKIDAPVLPIIASDDTNVRNCYRNKGQYPVGVNADKKVICGFYALHSHRIVACTNCKLQPEIFAPIVEEIIKFITENRIPVYDEAKHSGIVRHIYLRKTVNDDIMVCLVINADRLPKEMEKSFVERLREISDKIKTITLNINKKQTGVILGAKCRNLFGDGYLIDDLLSIKVKISPQSFYQVNHDMTEKLYKIAAEYANPDNKTILDLYCGTGTIGLTMADRAKRIIGVEIVESAVKDAVKNAEMNNIDNAEFICDNASNAAAMLAKKGISPDVVILDPPRKGADNELIETIANKFSPESVVYVSCDPATLARDLAKFETLGYKTEKVQPVDMFPGTSHVESVALMIKADK